MVVSRGGAATTATTRLLPGLRYGARRLLTPKAADIKSSEPCPSEWQCGKGGCATTAVRLFDVRFPAILRGQQTACAISETGFPRHLDELDGRGNAGKPGELPHSSEPCFP